MQNLHYIQSFVVFAGSRNIHEAARRLDCSPSTVTLHLQHLEKDLGFPLFLLQGKKKVLSKNGQILLDSLSPRLTALSDCLKSTGGRLADVYRQQLRIGGRREVLFRLAQDIAFDGTLDFMFLTEPEVHERFLSHDLDLAIVHDRRLFSPQVLVRKLFSSRSVLSVHRKWVSGANSPKFGLNPRFLLEVPALCYGLSDVRLQSVCNKMGVDPREIHVSVRVDDWNLLEKLVAQGAGYCLLPEDYVPKSAGILTLPVTEDVSPHRSFYAAYRSPVRELIRARKLIFRDSNQFGWQR